jgi:hypothetical protein
VHRTEFFNPPQMFAQSANTSRCQKAVAPALSSSNQGGADIKLMNIFCRKWFD